MRIAIFADIHGNQFATRAVLEAISGHGEFDAVVAAGDLCAGGSDPAGCIDLLRTANVQAVYGNADEAIFASQPEPPAEMYRPRWPIAMLRRCWAIEKLGEDRVNWLRELPFELRFSPTGNVIDDLLVVHANPHNTHFHIHPPEEIQLALYGEIRQPDDDPALVNLLEGTQAAVIAHGHFHYTSVRVLYGMQLVNVSPCSYSAFDPDRSARYTVFTWNGEWHIERRYVAYDFRQEHKALLSSMMPYSEESAKFFA